MPYMEQITRQNPTALLFLLDQSGSMARVFSKEAGKRKCDGATEVINNFVRGLIIDCTRQGAVGDYFYIGVIGYADKAVKAFGGALKDLELVPLSVLYSNPLRIEERIRIEKVDDGAGGILEQHTKIRYPVWFDPKSDGDTAMCHALEYAHRLLKGWTESHPRSFPPIVINISDGEPRDGNPTKYAEKLKSLSTSDGNALLFNFHISSASHDEILFPTTSDGLDKHARLLFNMSSFLSDKMVEKAKNFDLPAQTNSRGFGFNVSKSELLVNLLKIGTTAGGTQ